MTQGLVRDFKGRPLLSIPVSPDSPGNPEHAGAIMALIFVDEHGNPITDFGSGGGTGGPSAADQVSYLNSGDANIQTVQDALDKILFVPMTVSMSGGGNYEYGTSLASVNLSWSISKPIKTQLLTGPGAVQPAVAARSSIAIGPFTGNTAWSLLVTAADGVETKSASTGISFYNRRFWGTCASATPTDAEILNMSSELSNTRTQTRTMNGNGQYLTFGWPAGFGTPTFIVNGLKNTAWVEVIRSFTNSLGFSTSYRFYRSTYLQNGTGIQIQVQ